MSRGDGQRLGHVVVQRDSARGTSDVVEKRAEHIEFFGEQFEAFVKRVVFIHQIGDSLLGVARPDFRLFARLSDGDVVSFATFSVFVRRLVRLLLGPAAGRRASSRAPGRTPEEGDLNGVRRRHDGGGGRVVAVTEHGTAGRQLRVPVMLSLTVVDRILPLDL